jgi:phage shock protein E
MGNSNSNLEEVKNHIKEHYYDIILDVRTIQEWNSGHYNLATHIPLDEIKTKFHIKFPNKNIKILIYCRSGTRAGKAEEILKSQGYKNIHILNNSDYTGLL